MRPHLHDSAQHTRTPVTAPHARDSVNAREGIPIMMFQLEAPVPPIRAPSRHYSGSESPRGRE
eukprot:2291737-Alexandrium_andersonii.AAC.1